MTNAITNNFQYVSLDESGVNESIYIKAEELFNDGTQFAITGVGDPKETFFAGRKEASLTVEIDIVILASGEQRKLGMSWNGYRENLKNHFANGGLPIAPVVLVQLPTNNGNPAWGFAAPTDNLKEANKKMKKGNDTPF